MVERSNNNMVVAQIGTRLELQHDWFTKLQRWFLEMAIFNRSPMHKKKFRRMALMAHCLVAAQWEIHLYFLGTVLNRTYFRWQLNMRNSTKIPLSTQKNILFYPCGNTWAGTCAIYQMPVKFAKKYIVVILPPSSPPFCKNMVWTWYTSQVRSHSSVG